MTRKSQELKKEILRNLAEWCFDPLGDLVKAKLLANRTYQNINHYWFRLYQDDEANPNWRMEPKIDDFVLDSEDYHEVKEAMIKRITQNSQDWKVEKEGELTVIKHKSGWKHWKSKFSEGFKKGFRDEEWKEIESAINDQKQNPNQEDNQGDETPTSNQQRQAQQEQLNHVGSYHRGSKC